MSADMLLGLTLGLLAPYILRALRQRPAVVADNVVGIERLRERARTRATVTPQSWSAR